MIDTNELFREATLRICSNLEIDEALEELLQLLKGVMPVRIINLQSYSDDYHAMRTIAVADESGHRKLDLLTPLPEEAREKIANAPDDLDAFLVTDPMSVPISRAMFEFHNLQPSTIIVMVLRAGKQKDILGMIVFVSEENEPFDEDHRSLVVLLKEPLTISLSNALIHREVVKLNERLADDNRFLHGELRRASGDEIVGANFGLRVVTGMIRLVASLDSPVLLLGETGTGKDLIANSIHYSSSRSEGPFVVVNCGAIPDTLIDSELFGHEKGAFTGALSRKRGRFERAHQGTIFLDEIGELPLPAQVRILRVLQNKEIERVGGTESISLDIRIIAATNRNLEEMVRNGEFREDLWFRLNVFPILVPPLRKRTIDIPALIQHFIERKAGELKIGKTPKLADGAIDDLMGYRWPGNVRELENLVERAMILHREEPLRFDDLGVSLPAQSAAGPGLGAETLDLDEATAHHIRRVLGITGGKIHGSDGAGELLGVNPNTLRARMKKLGIPFKKHTKNE